jgi:hypothetical protein
VFDAAQTPELTLDVVARDECTPTRVTIAVSGPPNTPPQVEDGQALEMDEDLVVHGGVVGFDAEGDALSYALVGGSGEGVFSLDAASGEVRRIALPRFDISEYSLLVTASDGRETSAPGVVDVLLPERVRLCVAGHTQLVPRAWVPLALGVGFQIGACAQAADE